jgi:hypothetical protein
MIQKQRFQGLRVNKKLRLATQKLQGDRNIYIKISKWPQKHTKMVEIFTTEDFESILWT